MEIDRSIFPDKDKSGRPIIGHQTCRCGAIAPIKINSVGNVYFRCEAVVGKLPNGRDERCKTRYNEGSYASKITINEYLQSEGVKEDVQPTDRKQEDEEPTSGAIEPDRATTREPNESDRGFGGAVKHFFTAD